MREGPRDERWLYCFFSFCYDGPMSSSEASEVGLSLGVGPFQQLTDLAAIARCSVDNSLQIKINL